jgi:hypothetical protein
MRKHPVTYVYHLAFADANDRIGSMWEDGLRLLTLPPYKEPQMDNENALAILARMHRIASIIEKDSNQVMNAQRAQELQALADLLYRKLSGEE